MELRNKVALVTGGAVRVGKALSLALAAQGVRIAMHYNGSSDAAETTIAAIRELGSDAIAIRADLSQTDQVNTVMQQASDAFGPVDILVNNAAIFEPGSLTSTTEANWDRHFAINLKAPFFLSQAFAAQIGPDRPGHIINISDWQATRPGAGYMAYTLTKAAINSMTLSLALALAPHIQVNAILLGAILPPPGQGQAYFDKLAQVIPLRHTGKPADIADAMLYLLRSDFVSGDLLTVTGGQHL